MLIHLDWILSVLEIPIRVQPVATSNGAEINAVEPDKIMFRLTRSPSQSSRCAGHTPFGSLFAPARKRNSRTSMDETVAIFTTHGVCGVRIQLTLEKVIFGL